MIKKIFVWLLVLSLFLILFALSCKSKNSSSPPREDYSTNSYDIGVVFSTTPIELNNKGIKTSYLLKKNQFNGYYYLENNYPATQIFAIIALLDYKQTNMQLNSRSANVHYISVKKRRRIKRNFSIKNMPKEIHDFTIIAFSDPSNKSLKTDYRWETDSLFYYPQRASLILGSQQSKVNPLLNFPSRKNQSKSNFVKLNKNQNFTDKEWYSEKVKAGSNFKFYIQAGNYSKKEKSFAIMLFLDYRQIPVDKNNFVAYGKISQNQIISIPVNLKIPRKRGIYNLLALRAFSPFVKQKSTNLEEPINSTVRLGLKVF